MTAAYEPFAAIDEDNLGWTEPALDLEKYLADLEGIEATNEQKREMLSVLWSIMSHCVRMQLSGEAFASMIDGLIEASQDDDPGLSLEDT